MKHSILGFSQRRALALESSMTTDKRTVVLSLNDLIMLSIFRDIFNSLPEKRIFEEGIYAQIDFEKICSAYPILTIDENSFLSSLKRLVSFKILDVKKLRDEETLYSFYGFGDNYDFIVNDDKDFVQSAPVRTIPIEHRTKTNVILNKYGLSTEEFVEWWNKNTSFIKIKYLTESRIKALCNRLEECKDKEEFLFIMLRAAKSDFLTGRISGYEFIADIDFVLQKRRFLKIREGFYDNKPSVNRRSFTRLLKDPENEKEIDW